VKRTQAAQKTIATFDHDAESGKKLAPTRRALLQTAAAIGAGFAAMGTLRSITYAQDTPQSGGTLVVGLQSEPSDNIDPHVTPWAVSHNIMMNVYDTLVWQDPADGSFKAGLAESWEAAPDGMSYTFKLRTGVKFHDGTDFNADAVKFAFDRIIDPATKSGFSANLLGPYSGTDIIDANTVKVNFSKPYAPFLDSASQAFLSFVSPAAVAEYGADFGVTAAVGTGPFTFKEWVRGDHLTLVNNPDYNWPGAVFQHTGPAYVDEIIFRFIPEDASRTGTLQSGETNVIELIPTGDIQLLTDDGFQIVPGKAPGIPTIYLINTAKPPTDDLAVRKAMNLGTDQQAIIDAAYFGVYEPAAGPLAKVSWAFNPEVEGLYAYDPAAAIALLEEAGWVLNGDFREKDGQKLSIEYVTTDFDKHSELWQAQMREIGIEANIQMVDNGTWIDSGSKGGQNITIIGWISSDPVILEHLFHSKNAGTGFNWSFLKNTELDQILETGQATVDQGERKSLYGRAQQIIMDEAAVLPIYDQIGYNGVGKDVHDVRTDARGWYRWFYDTWIG
jgi:peptide/nickel transport system substrate-binding protein